jgi:hypothetical protein
MNISKYNLMEIFYILEDRGVDLKIEINTNKNHLYIETNVNLENPHMRKTNGHVIDNLAEATKKIREWLSENSNKYSVPEPEYIPTAEGYTHIIDIAEVN